MQVLVMSKIPNNLYNRPQKVRVQETDDVETLYQVCAKASGISQEELVIKFHRDGYVLRVVSGWSFQFYEIKENMVLYIESINDQEEQDEANSPRIKNAEMTRRLMELSRMKTQGILEGNFDPNATCDIHYPVSPANASLKPVKQKDELIKLFLAAVRKGEVEFSQFLQDHKVSPDLMNQCDANGWYPIHYAINYSNKAAFKYIATNSDNLNQTTKEGFTTLMLCANKKSMEFFKAILDSKKVDVNKVTKKGSILHFLAEQNDLQLAHLLLGTPINPYCIDQNKKVAVDLVTDVELKQKLIGQYEKDQNYSHLKKKPELIKGTVFKTGMFFRNLNTRYLELNTNERALIRYESKKDHPTKPIEIIPLRDIVSVKECQDRMFLQNGFYYFEVNYESRNIFATKSRETTTRWVQATNEAVDYALKYESSLKDINLDEKNMEILAQPAKEIDLDELPEETHVPETVVRLDRARPANSSSVKVNLETFEIIRKLGKGSFGTVYKVRCKINGKIYAMKSLPKDKILVNKQLRYAQAEANILRKNNNPFVLSLYFSFQTPTSLYMVFDCCSQQNLALLILKRNSLTESEARFYIAEIILAIEYLHTQGVLYRDLKPENVLIGLDGHLMLCDFGLSKENVGRNELATSFLGTRLYLAPEMVKGQGFTQASDVFAVGIVLYEMLFGELPYTATDERTLYEQIRTMTVEMPEEVSKDAEDLLLKLLIKDPEKRLGSKNKEDIKRHPFFKGLDWEKLASKGYHPPLYEPEYDRIEAKANIRVPDQDYDESNKNFLRVAEWSFVKASELK